MQSSAMPFGPKPSGVHNRKGCRPSASSCMKAAILYHCAINVVFFSLAVADLLIFQNAAVRMTTKYSSRLAVAGYALLGLPIALIGLWGVSKKREELARLYFFYAVVSASANFAYTVDAMVHFLPCATGALSAPVEHPDIFECGQPRGLLLLALGFAVGFHACMLYAVHGHCEDLRYDSEGREERLMAEDGLEGQAAFRMPTRGLAIAAQWAGFRKTPLNNVQGRLTGEFGSLMETASLLGSSVPNAGQHAEAAGRPHLPATRLV